MSAGGAVVWRHARSLAVVEGSDRVALIDLDHLAEPPRILDGSAALVWWAIDGLRPETAVVEAVAESCGVPAEEVSADVVAFLRSLADAGLIEGAP